MHTRLASAPPQQRRNTQNNRPALPGGCFVTAATRSDRGGCEALYMLDEFVGVEGLRERVVCAELATRVFYVVPGENEYRDGAASEGTQGVVKRAAVHHRHFKIQHDR